MKDQDKPIGFEYIISGEQYASLDKAEQRYWHYHKTEIPRAHATLPDLTAEETAPASRAYWRYIWESDLLPKTG